MKVKNKLEYDFIEMSLSIVRVESEKISPFVFDVTSFEQDCYRKILSAVRKIGEEIKDRDSLIKSIVRETSNFHLKTRNNPLSNSFDISKSYRVFDVLADVESQTLANEKISLLAEGDPREKIVLGAWVDGCNNDSEIAGLLADKLGGKKSCHRVFIQRFRTKCRDKLSNLAVA